MSDEKVWVSHRSIKADPALWPSIMQHVPSGTYFQHQDGGWYKFLMGGKYAEDDSNLVVMEHVWPFTPAITIRTWENLEKRFSRKSYQEFVNATTGETAHQETAQKLVALQKAERKRKEAAAAPL